jgi:hypothetical protein
MASERLNEALNFLDEAYSAGVVIEFRGGGLLFSKEHTTPEKTYWEIVEEAKARDRELMTALSYMAVGVQQRARATARDWDIPYTEAIAKAEDEFGIDDRAREKNYAIEDLRQLH